MYRTMTYSARTVFYFGIYLSVLGVLFLVVPNTILRLFELPETDEVWIRVVGMLAGALGFYYIDAARNDLTRFIQQTVKLRSTVILFFIAFVALGFTEPQVILFGVVDLLGALWTWQALRVEGRSA